MSTASIGRAVRKAAVVVAIAGASLTELIVVAAVVIVAGAAGAAQHPRRAPHTPRPRRAPRQVQPLRGTGRPCGAADRRAHVPGRHPRGVSRSPAAEIITNDNLNAKVDAQVYLKVKADEENVKASIYNVTNYQNQVVNLARTTLRNIIGTLSLKSANSERGKINDALRTTLVVETANWGIEILRTELKEIDPPQDVQETMNKVVKAENEKVAAVDFATATETQADGQRRAEIKKAEGIRQAKILEAQGEAQAIQLVNEAADKYFVGNAQMLRKLEAVERALYQNSKIVVPADTQLVNVIGELGGLGPEAADRPPTKIAAVR